MKRAAVLSLLAVLSPFAVMAQSSAPKPDVSLTGKNSAEVLGAISGNIQIPKLVVISGGNSNIFMGRLSYPGSDGCPVNMRAQRMGLGGSMVLTDSVHLHAYRTFQRIHLTLTNRQQLEIVAARITVHGFTAKPRVSSADYLPDGPGEIVRTLDLNLAVAGLGNESTNLMLHSFASVSEIDLDSVDYADGTSWSASRRGSCQIIPDRFMLISSR